MMKVLTDIETYENTAQSEDKQNRDEAIEKAKCGCPEVEEACLPGVCLVCPGLLLSGAFAGSAVALRRLRPACVICAAADALPAEHDAQNTDACFLRIPVLDTPDADIFQYFDLATDLIHQVREGGGRTLVHCVAGVSRSATLCLAYLMKYEGMNLRDAYRYLHSKRSQIRPNTGFFKQLIKYEQQLFGETSVKMVYCEVIDKGIPDVYEPDYQAMTWYMKRYGQIVR